MWWLLVILFVAATGIGIVEHLKRCARLRLIKERPCAGVRWRRSFPDASPESIRTFLCFFADAFNFPKKYQQRLRPTDRLMDIYHVLNPPGWSISDVMEFETLDLDLERDYDLIFEDVWHEDLTLGELFKRTRA